MGMSKAARMLMMNRSGNHKNGEDYRDSHRDMNDHKERYRDDYNAYDRDPYNRERRNEDYGDRREVRAGGTFWMDNPHKDMKFDRNTAEQWVSEMKSRDGTKGGKWTYDQTTQVMKQKGFDCDPADFFVAMNAIYSDYSKTLSKYGVTAPEAYAELAYDWVKDPDAHKDKAARYYEYIVK